jgi:hypothetical protein
MTALPGPPQRVLPPLTSSLVTDGRTVAGALARRTSRRDESAAIGGTVPQRDILAGVGGIDEDDEGDALVVEELPPVREAEGHKREARASTGHGVQRSTYTLGELVEMIRDRKVRSRQIVASGDIDGEEPEIDEDDILLNPRSARRPQ